MTLGRARKVRAALLDLDGLAVDSEPFHVEAWRRAMEAFGRPFDPTWIRTYFGRPVSETARGLGRAHRIEAAKLLEAREAAFDELTAGGIQPRQGLLEAVTILRGAGLATAIVSSGTRAYVRRALEAVRRDHGLEFHVVVTRDDVDKPKPDPEPFLRAATLLDVPPSACAVLEDAPNGIAAAKAAGMVAVAVPNPHTAVLDFSAADAVLPDLVMAAKWVLRPWLAGAVVRRPR